MRTSIALSAALSVVSLTRGVLATPPACLLACVAQVSKKSSSCGGLNEVSCLCEKESSGVKSCLDSACPDDQADAAYSAFKGSCSEQNASILSLIHI